jgi:hypothetical protein
MLHKNDFRAFVLLMMLLPAGTLLSQTAGAPATFDGQVMNRSNGRPLAGVTIKLHGSVPISKDPREYQQYSATSGADGRFVISGISPGEYGVSVARDGYSQDNAMPGAEKDALPQQRLASGESAHSVLFMVPLPIITGRVLDSKGAPVEHVDVHAIGTEYSQYAPTDDRGEFRMVVNGPGPYLLKAAPDKHYPSEIRRDGTTPVVYGLTYFQSSHSPVSAEWVTAQFGKETNIEIKLQPASAVQISGTVSGIPPGERATLWLKGVEEIDAVTDQEGRFTLWRVPAGRYRLHATVDRWGNSKALPNNEPLGSRHMMLDVGAASIEGIHLEMTPPVALKLKFRDADWQKYKTKKKDVSFELRAEDLSVRKSLNDNGEFTMDKLAPGSYHVVMDGLPENLYVKALRPSQGEATRNTLEIGNAPEQQVEIELGTDGAEISGVVRTKTGEATEAEVFLLDDEDPDLAEVETTTAEKDGHYQFDGVAPGKYRLLAHTKDGLFRLRVGIPGLQKGIIKDPETKELFRAAMEKIEVSSGEKATKDLKIY